MAKDLGGQLKTPTLPWKYSWMKIVFGWPLAKYGQQVLLKFRWKTAKWFDKIVSRSADNRLDMIAFQERNPGLDCRSVKPETKILQEKT
jgi:hypothetical protein